MWHVKAPLPFELSDLWNSRIIPNLQIPILILVVEFCFLRIIQFNCWSYGEYDFNYINMGKISWFPSDINTHYIHSVMVQDFVSGRACCVNQYHYKSLLRRVVVRFVHTTSKTWYKILYKHTVISLFNISIKTNFKKITRIEIRLTDMYNTLRETTFCSWRHVYMLPFIILLC